MCTFIGFTNLFTRYRSKISKSELSLMATEIVSIMAFFFHIKKFHSAYFLNLIVSFFLCCTIFELGFTPCKVDQPLQGTKLHEKEAQKD